MLNSGEAAAPLLQQWLLNLTVEGPMGMPWILPDVKAQALNVRPIPGYAPKDYAVGLRELAARRFIEFHSEIPEDDVNTEQGISQMIESFLKLPQQYSADLFRRGSKPKPTVHFKMTELGGQAWERVASPDWNRFVYASSVYSGGGSKEEFAGELISVNRDLILAYMGWYPEVRSEQIRLETVEWQIHADFPIFYWKKLPLVFHASFQSSSAEARWATYRKPKWFEEWQFSTQSWYKPPWELPNWPRP